MGDTRDTMPNLSSMCNYKSCRHKGTCLGLDNTGHLLSRDLIRKGGQVPAITPPGTVFS